LFNYRILRNILKAEEILLYLRKSRSDDPSLTTEEVLSKHETILDEWIANNLDAPIPEENRFREIVSGESIAERPEFRKVLKLLESPKYKAVLVVEVSRLGRPDMEEIGRLSKLFRYTNTLVVTPTMTFDIANEYERDMFERELKRGNEYLEYTKKLLRRGRELSVKSGNFVCSRPVYGYDKITILDGKRKCPTLAINEEQANIVRTIFDWYVNENIGTQTIADRLNDLNITPPRADRFSADSIRTIVENPIYIGKVRWNTRKAVHVVRDGQILKTRPVNEDEDVILVDGKHEAIITEAMFLAAQAKRGRTHRACSNKELRNPLASLLYCECGRAMSYTNSTRNKKPKGDPRLKCNAQKYCNNGSCSVNEILPFIVDILQKKILAFEIEAKQDNEDAVKAHERIIDTLERKLADIKSKEIELWKAQMKPETKVPDHVVNALSEEYEQEREETEKALAKEREKNVKPKDYERKIVTLQTALDALLDDEKSIAEKNMHLKECIERITYHRDPITPILGKGSGKKRTAPPIKLDVKLAL
jgi:hypothetical protein